jgi:hypothetical protein
MEWVTSIIGGLIGAVIASLFVIWVEYSRKPKLRLRIADPVDSSYTNRPANQARYLCLMVENKKLPRMMRWLLRDTAAYCHGIINFYHLDGQDIFGRKMEARWSWSTEPVPMIATLPSGQQISIFDPVKLSPELHRNIHSGESERMDIAARFDSDVECYGWCNDNYFSSPRWRNPDWRLDQGRYIVKVMITYSGESRIDLFRLINDVPISAFRLVDALPGDYQLVNTALGDKKG